MYLNQSLATLSTTPSQEQIVSQITQLLEALIPAEETVRAMNTIDYNFSFNILGSVQKRCDKSGKSERKIADKSYEQSIPPITGNDQHDFNLENAERYPQQEDAPETHHDQAEHIINHQTTSRAPPLQDHYNHWQPSSINKPHISIRPPSLTNISPNTDQLPEQFIPLGGHKKGSIVPHQHAQFPNQFQQQVVANNIDVFKPSPKVVYKVINPSKGN